MYVFNHSFAQTFRKCFSGERCGPWADLIFLYKMCLQEKFDELSALVAVIDWAEESILPWIHSAEEEVKVQRKRSVTSSASRHDLCLQILKVHMYEHALGTHYWTYNVDIFKINGVLRTDYTIQNIHVLWCTAYS